MMPRPRHRSPPRRRCGLCAAPIPGESCPGGCPPVIDGADDDLTPIADVLPRVFVGLVVDSPALPAALPRSRRTPDCP